MFSVCFREHLTDGDVIVVEVFREPLLAQGLVGVLDISLCDEVVVGLITSGRFVLGQGAKVLSGSTQVFIHDIKEVEGVGQKEQQEDKRDDEEGDEVNGEVEEIRSNAHRAHER